MVLYYILLPLAWLVFHIGFRVHTIGRENLRKVQTKGCIIAPNHVSAIDPVFIVISRFWGRRMLVFAKKELDSRELIELKLEEQLPQREFFVVTEEKGSSSLAAQELLRMLSETAEENAGGDRI